MGRSGFLEAQARAWEEIREWAQEAEESSFVTTRPGGSWDGPGSSLDCTERLRDELQAMLARLNVHTMLDVACGDWNWMRLVDLTGIEYTGWDVDPGRIARCRYRIGIGDFTSTDRPNTHFEQVNALEADANLLSEYDLVLARDFLPHLPNGHIQEFLGKLTRGGSQWLLASTYPHVEDNTFTYDPTQYAWNGYMEHPINLEIPPFNMRKVDAIVEESGPGGVIAQHHELGLFALGGTLD